MEAGLRSLYGRSRKMTRHAFVFARAGSKGVPGKNSRSLAGRPLISYSIEIALSMSEIESVFVSTDDPAVAEIAGNLGCHVIDRPPALARDDSPEWLSWQHAATWVREHHGDFSQFISLPATSPLRLREDVENCIGALDESADMSICITPSATNPWFSMVSREPSGRLSLLASASDGISRRQEAPVVYDITGVAYAAWTSFVTESPGMWSGVVRGVVVPRERAVDIDEPLDFDLAELLMLRRQAGRMPDGSVKEHGGR